METTEESSEPTYQTVVKDTLQKAADEADEKTKQAELDKTMLEQINSSMYNYKEALDTTLNEVRSGGELNANKQG